MTKSRIDSIDLLRGLVIVLMGLDHVRDFFGPTRFRPEDLSEASAMLFLTRWVTHFCAPVFLFLAGLGAALYLSRGHSKGETARFLLTRGLFLVVLELAIINTSWLSYWNGYMFVQVIWAIGWSMVGLAGLLFLPRVAILVFSLVVVFGHNLLDYLPPEVVAGWGPAFSVLRGFQWIPAGDSFGVMVIYSVVPWVGVMSLGYLFGRHYELSFDERKKRLMTWGVVLSVLFVVLRAVNLYGDPAHWQANERGILYTVLSFLNATKYPASLAFILMTLGPALLALPYLEKVRGKLGGRAHLSQMLVTFGRVPLFFYVVHIPLIHLLAMLYSKLRYGFVGVEASGAGSLVGWYLQGQQYAPEGYVQNLWLVWGVWIAVTVALYWPCRRYAELKKTSDLAIFSYL